MGRPTSRQHLLMNFSSSLRKVSLNKVNIAKINMEEVTADISALTGRQGVVPDVLSEEGHVVVEVEVAGGEDDGVGEDGLAADPVELAGAEAAYGSGGPPAQAQAVTPGRSRGGGGKWPPGTIRKSARQVPKQGQVTSGH